MVEFWQIYYFTMIMMGLFMMGLMVAIIGFTVAHGYKKNKKGDENEK